MDYWTDLFCPKNYLYDQDFLTCATVSCFWSISKWYLPHCTEPHNKIRYGWRWCYCYTLSPSYSLCSTRVKVLPWMARYKEEEKSCVQDSSVVWHRFSIVLEIKDHILQNTDYLSSICLHILTHIVKFTWLWYYMSMTTLLKQQQMLSYYPALCATVLSDNDSNPYLHYGYWQSTLHLLQKGHVRKLLWFM